MTRSHNHIPVAVGDRFGRWSVVNSSPDVRVSGKHYRPHYLVRCECGTQDWVYIDNLRRGLSMSCGCYLKEIRGRSSVTHGMSKTKIYAVWNMMQQRINVPTANYFHRYGGRGLDMDPRWQKFENFYADMGDQPFKGATLERKDNDAGYWPDNVVWATRDQQARNKVNTALYTFRGESKTLREWADEVGINASTLASRVYSYGWAIEKALTTPAIKRKV